MNVSNPFISFIYDSQKIEVDYLTFAKLSNYPEILKLPHSFSIHFEDSENPEVINVFFSYLKTGIVEVSTATAIEVYGLAQRYQFYLLAKHCDTYIFETLDPLDVINQVHQYYSEGKDITIYQNLFGGHLFLFSNPSFFKFPLDYILNTFRLGRSNISVDNFIQFSIQLYEHDTFRIQALDILQYINLSEASVESLEALKDVLLRSGKPFPHFDYVCNTLNNRKAELSQSDDELTFLRMKRDSLAQTLISQMGQQDHRDTISFLSELLQSGNLIGASDEQIFNNFLNISEITNSVDSLLEVAHRYEKGIGTRADRKKAMEYYAKAANTKNEKALIEYAQKIIETPNYLKPKAEFRLIKYTSRIDPEHCYFGLGNFYRNGHGCKKNNLRAMHYYLLAYKGGVEQAKPLLMELSALTNPQTEKEAKSAFDICVNSNFDAVDEETEIPLLKLVADSEYPRAIISYFKLLLANNQYKEAKYYCNHMIELQQSEGYSLLSTYYIKKSKFAKLEKLLKEVAETQHLAVAYHYLAMLYYAGLIIPNDNAKEYQYLQIASDAGYEPSIFQLEKIEFQAKSYLKGYKLLEKYAKGKHYEAKSDLGQILLTGQIDGKSQVSRGLSLIREAAEAKCCKACYQYGKILCEGKYIEKNEIEALKYLAKGIPYPIKNISNDCTPYIDTFYLKAQEKAVLGDDNQPCAIYFFSCLRRTFKAETGRFIALDDLLKSMVHCNSLAFRYKAAQILLEPEEIVKSGFCDSPPNYKLQIRSTLEDREREAIEHLRQSSDGGSICGMFQYALHLLFLNEKNSHILSKEKEVDSTYYNLKNCKEAMDLLLKAGINGFDLALLFYSIYALKFPELVDIGIAYLKFLAFDKNFLLAKTQLGILNYQCGNYETACRFLKENAYKNDREAQYYYGKMLMNGYGVTKDPSLALNFFHMSDDAGFKPAQVMLVNLLLEMKDKLQLQSYLYNKFEKSSYVMYKYSSLFFDKYFDKVMIDESIAIDLLKLSSLMNDSDGLWKYGTFLRDGFVVAKNPHEAIELFRKSADLGNPSGKSCFANYLIRSAPAKAKRRPSDVNILGTPRIGLNYFKDSYENNNRTGAWCYANCLMRGIGCEMDQLKALSIYVNLSKTYNDRDAQYTIFKMLYNGVIVNVNTLADSNQIAAPKYVYLQDIYRALRYLIKAANNGHSTAQWRLGEFLLLGKHFNRKDGKTAIHYFQLSAEQGNPRGIWYYSKCLIDGRGGVQKDVNKALKFLEKLCQNQKSINGDAEFMYGSLLIDQMNKITEGVKFIQQSALECGNADGLWKLGDLYMKGIGVEKDTKKAKEYFVQSEQKGNKTALFKLSELILLKYDDPINKLIENEKKRIQFGSSLNPTELFAVELKENEIDELLEAMKLLKNAVAKNQSDAQLKFAHYSVTGLAYHETVFVAKDVQHAIELFKVASDFDVNNDKAYLMYGLLTQNLSYISRSALLGNSIARITYGKSCFGIPSTYNDPIASVDTKDYIYELKQDDSNSNMLLQSTYAKSVESMNSQKDINIQNEKLAAYYFKLTADKGNSEAQYLFALCLKSGRGIPKDIQRAYEYFQKSAELGYIDSKYEMAIYLYSSQCQIKDQNLVNKKYQYLKDASDGGNVDAFYKISKIERDYPKIIEAARKGSKKAIAKCAQAFYMFPNPEPISMDMMDLGNSNLSELLFVNLPRDEAFSYLQQAAKYNAKCAFYYGLCLRNGINVSKNDKEAFRYIKSSFKDGFKEKAAAILGLYYLKPDVDVDDNPIAEPVAEKNAPLAFNLFTESLSYNDVFGMNCLGYCYYTEKGLYSNQMQTENLNAESLVSSTMKNAIYYLKLAYTNEEPSGVNNYAVAMFQGNLREGGPCHSVPLFIKSAKMGCLTAIKNLKKIYDPTYSRGMKDMIPEMPQGAIQHIEQQCIEVRKDNIFHVELALNL